ncbi:MAG: creatininase family protein [Ruminococcaceae bacterium]|nr:creatininase family protein [Oscillospiraceae bacterium]
MIWANLREEEFAEAIAQSKGVCVFPMGCFEMHGQHLPVGTDILHSSFVLKKAAEIEPVCIFPDFCFGDVQGHTLHRGGIVLTVELIQRLLTELCREIARNGFKKILIYNGHGGNTFIISNFIRSTMHDKKDYVVLSKNLELITPAYFIEKIDDGQRDSFPELNDSDIAALRDYVSRPQENGHGCFSETALMLGSYPETVRMDRRDAVDGRSTHRADYLDKAGLTRSTRFWSIQYPNALSATPYTGLSERIGQACVRVAAEQLADAIKVLKEEDQILRWNEAWNNAW